MKRFKCILPKKKWADPKAACVELIQEMKQDLKEVQVGVMRVLYRAAQHNMMELLRNVSVPAGLLAPLSHVRRCSITVPLLFRHTQVAVEKTVIFLQRITRGWLARRLKRKLRAVRVLACIAANATD